MNNVPVHRGAALRLVFLLAAAALLAAAGPAAAYTVQSPLFLGKSNLNGAIVTLHGGAADNFNGAAEHRTGGQYTFWSVSGVPAGATVTISGVSLDPSDRKTVDVTLRYTGDFTSDFDLSLTATYDVFNVSDGDQTFTLPVLVNGTRRLEVGSVTGQATEAGGTATFPVSLGTPIEGAVTVSVSSVDGTEGAASPSSLTFSTSNWSTPQTVTVTGEDDDVDDGTVTWQVRLDPASGGSGGDSGYHGLANVDVDVTTTDDDTAGITVGPATATAAATTTLRTTEGGGQATFTVVLDSEPTGNVVLNVASSDTGEGTVDTDSATSGDQGILTFTASNWNTAQTVTLTGVDDTPTSDSPNPKTGTRTWTVSLTVDTAATADDDYDALSDVTVHAVNADDEVGLNLGPVSGQATEGGGTATFTVALLSVPAGAVTVSVSSLDTGEGQVSTGGGAPANTTTLTFSTTSWDTAQTVTVTGQNDDVHDGVQTWAVRLDTSSGGSGGDARYHILGDVDVSVSTTDNETAPVVALSLSSGSIAESGGTSSVSATLSGASAAATTITVTGVSGVYTVGPDATIEFAAGDTTSTDTVTITAVDDDVHQGAAGRTATVTGTVANDVGGVGVTGASLALTDDDTAPNVTLSLSDTLILESGGTSSVSAVLSGRSAAATTVTVTAVSGAYTVPSGRGARIVIAAGATTSTDRVTITAADNTRYEANRVVAVTATLANSRGTGSVTGATITLDDNDSLPTVSLAVSPSTISENGGTGTVSAVLTNATDRATTVTVTAVSGAYTVPSGASGRIVIAAGATTSSDTVTITAVDNDVDAADAAVTVTGTARNYWTFAGTLSLTGASLTITDDDTVGIEVSPGTSTSSRLVTTEANNGQATFTVTLATEPTGNVELDVASSDTGEGTVSPSSLTFTTSNWNTAQTVTLTGQNDALTDRHQSYTVTLTVDQADTLDTKYDDVGAITVYAVNVDDEVGLTVGPVSGQATEAGGTATFTVVLRALPQGAVEVSVASRDPGEGQVSTGGGAPANTATLTFSTSSWNTAQTVTVTGVDDSVHDGDVTWAVRLDTSSGGDPGYDGVPDQDVSVITTDDDAPDVVLAVSAASIAENGGTSVVSATLTGASSVATTITVTGVSGVYTVGSDAEIVIPAGDTANATDTVTITAVDDDVHQGAAGRSTTVTATIGNSVGGVGVTGVSLALTDDEPAPDVTLSLSAASIAEDGGTSVVSAVLSGESAAATTVTVAAVSGAYTVPTGAGARIVIAAGATTSSDTVTITAVNDDVHQGAPGRAATVTATLANSAGTGSVAGVSLALTDDESAPDVTLSLSAASITEDGGTSVVSAVLSGESAAATTVTVTAVSGAYTVPSGASGRIVIAAGDTTSTDTVTITAVDDDVHQGATGRAATVTATAANSRGAGSVAGAALALTDDESAPGVTLSLSAASISENGGTSVVSAVLSGESAAATTVTVTAAPGAYTVPSGAAAQRIVIAAGDTTSTDTVTITAVDDDVHQGAAGRAATVTATAANSRGAGSVDGAALALTDDESLPAAALALTAASIGESGASNVTTVTATLSGESSEAVTLTVSAAPGSGTDFTLSSDNTLTIAAGQTTSAGTVTITARDDTTDSPDKSVTVSATAQGGNGVSAPSDLTLTITDDDVTPTATLALSDTTIDESGSDNVSTVTAALTNPSSDAVTVTVSAAPGSGTDFTLSEANTLTIAAGQTTSTGTVTITANDDTTDSPDKQVTVSGSAAGGRGVADPAAGTLTITDDDDLPTVTLALTAASIDESGTGNVSTVTAALSHPSSDAVTVTVGAAPVDSTGAVAGDFTLSQANTLTIAAGATTSTGDVTVTAVDNPDDEPDIEVTVSGSAAGGRGVADPTARTLTIRDDDGAPLVTLALSASSIGESGTGNVSTVTAALNRASSAATTVTVSAAPVDSTGAVAGDYTLSEANTLTIAAGATTSTGDVTVTAVDNGTDAPDKQVTVSGAAANSQGIGGDPSDVTLTITDDEAAPTVALSVASSSIPENGGSTTVRAALSRPSSEATTVTVTAVADAYTVASGAGATIVIAAGDTTSTDTATINAADDDVHQGTAGRSTTVTAAAANGHGVGSVTGASLALTDDESAPGVTLSLSAASITEDGGTSVVSAVLSGESAAATTVTVTAVSGAYTVPSGAGARIVIAAGATTSAGTVTITAVDDDVHQGATGREATVTATAANSRGAGSVTGATLTLEDDEGLPTVALVLTPASVSETNGESSVTATLSGKSSEAVTVTVGAAAGTGAVGADFTLSGANTLTIAAGDTTSTGDVTVTANGNDRDSPDKSVTVSGTAEGGNNVENPPDVTLTLEDDDATPTVTLVLTPASVTESGGESSVTATLSGKSSAAVTVTVGAAAGTGAVGADFTLSGANTLTIAAGDTTSTGDVTVTANGNDVDSPDKSVTVSGTLTGGHGLLSAPANVTLTLEDDDVTPTATLALSPATIDESGTGNVSTVTATLNHGSSEALTITVSAAPVTSTGAVAGDYTLSQANTLTIAAGATTSTGDVTVTAVDNPNDEPDIEVTVSGSADGGRGVADPSSLTLTIRDDDGAPLVTLALSASSIDESGAGNVSTVTATLNRASSAATTVTVSAAPVGSTGAVAGDYTLSEANTLTIAAGDTTSTGDVTVTAVDNGTDAPDKEVTVSGEAANSQGIGGTPPA